MACNSNNNNEKKIEENYEEITRCVKNLQKNGFDSIEFSVDLVKATHLFLLALDYLYDTKELRIDAAIEYSLLRYRQFLCLKHKIHTANNGESHDFVPPPDVQVLWGTHQIRQQKYRKDLSNQFGIWFDHFPYSRECYKEEIIKSTKQWEDEYPSSSYIPNFETHLEYLENYKEEFISKVTLSIGIEEVKEDFNFISLCKQHSPDYHDLSFLQKCVEKYKKFLYNNALQKHQGIWKASIGPKIDTDSAWYAHQLCGGAYERDLMKNIGFVFFRTPNSEAECNDNNVEAENTNHHTLTSSTSTSQPTSATAGNSTSSTSLINNEETRKYDNPRMCRSIVIPQYEEYPPLKCKRVPCYIG